MNRSRGGLNPMYQSRRGLNESPFFGNCAAQFVQHSPTHEEALARLQFIVDNHRRVGLLTGDSGSGKSLVLSVFADRLRRRGMNVTKISLLGLEPVEMLFSLAVGLKLSPSSGASTVVLWRIITDRLAEFHYENKETVILLDEADAAKKDVLDHLARLARYDVLYQPRLTLILAGRRKQLLNLGQDILDLAGLRIDLEPWDQADTANFLNESLARCGRKTPAFSHSALNRLYELSRGVPRRTAQLADLALLAGDAAELPQIDADVIDSAYHELAVEAE
jgi:general secretion pathway protein A